MRRRACSPPGQPAVLGRRLLPAPPATRPHFLGELFDLGFFDNQSILRDGWDSEPILIQGRLARIGFVIKGAE